ncbi:hypothetical protein [Budvicia diplopodorum]|uniref:hypothetical protein n=1 Tax=Budvicia diplopodorum TaxID=1119056 RepID=UPI0013576608|nr:hypothetical protein [Budvicia diplopodorum]
MKRLAFILMIYPLVSVAQPLPEEPVMLSCLLAKSANDDIRYKNINVRNVRIRGDNSSNGMSYTFPYDGKNLGYFEKYGKGEVIYNEQSYTVEKSQPLTMIGAPSARALAKFDFSMAGWAEVDSADRQYLCINFPFGGAGLGNGDRDLTYAFVLSLTVGQQSVLYSWAGDIRKLTSK